MSFLEYLRKNYPNANTSDANAVVLTCKAAEEYAELVREKSFNIGFDEGYTNPMENNGERISPTQYEIEKKSNYDKIHHLLRA